MPYPPNGPGFTPYAYYLNYGRWPGPDAQISTPLVYDDCLTVEQQFASWWADQRDQTGALKKYTDDKVAEEAQIREKEDKRVLQEAKDYTDDKAADLQARLNAEIARAKTEEGRIELESKARDDAEEAARIAADEAFDAAIKVEIARAKSEEGRIEAESKARDDKLTQDLAAEVARATDAEEQLQDNIDAEAAARKNADDAEEAARKKGDADLQAHLEAEEADREAADAAEQADRIAADKKLYDIVVSALKTAYLDETGTMHFTIENWS